MVLDRKMNGVFGRKRSEFLGGENEWCFRSQLIKKGRYIRSREA